MNKKTPKKLKRELKRKLAYLKVGEFYLFPGREDPVNKIWIQHESGEGGDFNTADFEKEVSEFYKNNF